MVLGSYLAVFFATLILSFTSKKVKRADKKPFLCLTNAYTGVSLAALLLFAEFANAVMFAALFWVAGYLLYGLLIVVSLRRNGESAARGDKLASLMPIASPSPRPTHNDVPAAKTAVRLEHAATVTDKLLEKNLAKSDRQDVERMRNNIGVMQIKGALSPAEADILNDNFNALLKLMAKYNV